jgi:hypothetical protein
MMDNLAELKAQLAKLEEQRDAALKIHTPRKSNIFRGVCTACSYPSLIRYPCPTAQALGVTEEWTF